MLYFLRMEVTTSKKGISFSQWKYALDLLTKTGILGCKHGDISIEVGKRSKELGDPMDKDRYQKLVRKLIYLSHPRPDITFIVNVVSQYMHSPTEAYFEAIYKILGYLKR